MIRKPEKVNGNRPGLHFKTNQTAEISQIINSERLRGGQEGLLETRSCSNSF